MSRSALAKNDGMTRPLFLVVDDEEAIRRSLALVLEDEGFSVSLAAAGDEAIELARKLKPDVVYLDIWMPGMDGIDALLGIRAVSPSSQVIMISGHATIQNALEATKRGAFDFIEKPLDLEHVVLAARRALEATQLGNLSDSADVLTNGQDEELPLLSHQGITSRGAAGVNLGQRTIGKSTVLYGQGLHSGRKSGLVLEPLPRNSGIHFARIGRSNAAPAFVDNVDSTSFATTVGFGQDSSSTIEHLMSALHAYGISNLLVKCNGEVPILDGSAVQFCDMLESVGIVEQGGDWFEIAPSEKLVYAPGDGRESIVIESSEQFIIEYHLNYPAPVGALSARYVHSGVESFRREIAPARTFGFMRDIERLQKAGLAAGGRLDNFILIGEDRIVNTDLRYPDELARHKVLDCIGDIFLLGRPIRAKITATMTGHSDNIALLRMLRPLACAAN